MAAPTWVLSPEPKSSVPRSTLTEPVLSKSTWMKEVSASPALTKAPSLTKTPRLAPTSKIWSNPSASVASVKVAPKALTSTPPPAPSVCSRRSMKTNEPSARASPSSRKVRPSAMVVWEKNLPTSPKAVSPSTVVVPPPRWVPLMSVAAPLTVRSPGP